MQPTNFENIENKDGFYVTETVISGATAANYGVIFTAIHPCEVMAVSESHTTAGSDAGSVTLNVERLEPGEALNSGDTLLATAFNLKSTINTPVTYSGGELTISARQLKPGDRLALKDTGTLTAVAGVQVTVYLKRLGKGGYN